MPVIYDLRKDLRFKEGVEEGELKRSRAATIRLLKKGIASVATIAEIVEMPISFVLQIQKELLKDPTLK